MNSSTLTLEQRLSRLEAIEEIKQLKARYSHFLDNGYDPEGIASLFAEDGEWIIEGQAIKGREAIMRHCERLPRVIPWSLHIMTTSTVTIEADGEHANCVFYVQSTQTMNIGKESNAYLILGVFRDKCVKINGQWLFAEVRADIQQSCLWTEGWVKNPAVKGFFKMDE